MNRIPDRKSVPSILKSLMNISAWSPSGSNRSPGLFSLITLVSLIAHVGAFAADTAQWIKGSQAGNWGDAANWDINQVPTNGSASSFIVIIPNSSTVTYDLPLPAEIDALNLGSGSLNLGEGSSLSIRGVSLISGGIIASGEGATFQSLANGVTFRDASYLRANAGGTLKLSASTYNLPSGYGSHAIFTADGANSLVELDSMQSLSAGGACCSSYSYSITAQRDGVIRLSGLRTLVGASDDDFFVVNLLTGGQILMPSLESVSRRTRWNIDVPEFELASLANLSGAEVNVSAGRKLTMPVLSAMDGVELNVRAGAIVNASNLLAATGTSFGVVAGSVLNAPNLKNLSASVVVLVPDAEFNIPAPTQIDSLSLENTSGTTFAVGASSYSLAGGYGNRVLFRGDGIGSDLDLSSIQSLSSGGACCSSYSYSIIARNGASIDFRGLRLIAGATDDDWVDFTMSNNGRMDFSNLESVSRRTRWNVDVARFELPRLVSFSSSIFSVAQGRTLSVPALETMSSATISLGFGSRLDAPSLKSATSTSFDLIPGSTFSASQLTIWNNSSLVLTPGVNLVVPPPIEIDSFELVNRSGAPFKLAAPTISIGSGFGSRAILAADGLGSDLELKLAKSISAGGACCSSYSYSISAKNGAKIDLSEVTTVLGATDDDYLDINYESGGLINLSSLNSVSRRTRWNIDVPVVSFPALSNSVGAVYNVGGGKILNLPELLVFQGGTLNLANGAVVNAPHLVEASGSSFGLVAGSTLDAPELINLSGSSLAVVPGVNLNIGAPRQIDALSLLNSSGSNFVVEATSYSLGNGYGSRAIFTADGEGSDLDLRTLESISAGGACCSSYSYSISARNGGQIDLSGLESASGATDDDWLDLSVAAGGMIRLGDAVLNRRIRLFGDGSTATFVAGGITAANTSRLSLTGRARLRIEGFFRFESTDPSAVNLSEAVVEATSARRVELEVGGTDAGPTGFATGNFGLGRLEIGLNGAVNCRLRDSVDNGHRAGSEGREALYLFGLEGVSLRLGTSSALILGGINAYARVNGTMTHLNALIPDGRNSVAFGDGIIATTAGAAVTSCVPAGRVLPPISTIDLAFDIPIRGDSFAAADIRLTGPAGEISVTSITAVGGTTYRLGFGTLTEGGTYRVQVGPNIADAAGLLVAMDQDGDGIAGEPVDDVFEASFEIDVLAPVVLSAASLSGSGRVGVCFDEPVDVTWASDTKHFTINGSPATKSTLRADGLSLELEFPGLVGDTFSLAVLSAVDPLGNISDRSITGPILTLQSQDVGTLGTNPRERGAAFTCDGLGFNVVAGGVNIWSASGDGFHFIHEARTGDFDIQVRVDSLLRRGDWTAAGLMARESTAAGSRSVFAGMSPPDAKNQYFTIIRSTTSAAGIEWPGEVNLAGVSFPNAWVRLRRDGDVFKAFRSSDGLSWIQIGEIVQVLPSTLRVGLASTAYNNAAGQATEARYSHFGDLGPSILTHPQNQTVASGVNVSLAVTARGQPPLSYQWRFNGDLLSGEASAKLLRNSITTDQAGPYDVIVSNGFGSVTSLVARVIVDGSGSEVGGFEADVAPRPDGNNTVSIADWSQVGRFVAGLDTTSSLPEFVRADCAPSATRGNGVLTVADWTQAGRYAAALDSMVSAGGPTAGAQLASAFGTGDRSRLARAGVEPASAVGMAATHASGEWLVQVQLASRGWENALGFSIEFDAGRLKLLGVDPGMDLDGAFLQVNDRSAPEGRIGMAIARNIGQAFSPGIKEIVRLRFAGLAEAEALRFRMVDMPILREAVDSEARTRAVAFAGTTWGSPRAAKVERVRFGEGGKPMLSLSGTDGFEYELQASDDLVMWRRVGRGVVKNGSLSINDESPPGATRFYRANLAPETETLPEFE
jgi:hypothetical protein